MARTDGSVKFDAMGSNVFRYTSQIFIGERKDVSVPKVTPAPTASPSISKTAKPVDEGTLEDLIKGFKELKVEMSELRKARGSNSFQPSDS